MDKIASFTVDHDKIIEGIYISRIDGDIVTYDMRTRKPNCGDVMDNLTMHSVEHMFATFARNSAIKDNVIYFGPMGCQTGFYFLVKEEDPKAVLAVVKQILADIIAYDGEMVGQSRKECGNYRNLNLEACQIECKRYLDVLNAKENTFRYE